MTFVPSPKDLRFPYSKWRENQAETIQAALDSPKKVVFISGPTGTGKSAIAVALSKLSGRKSAIVTHTKGLQRQYIKDFKKLDLAYIIGRENYKCLIDKKYTVANAPCTASWKCPKVRVCDYYATKIRAGQWFAPVITNYSYFLGENIHAPGGLLSDLDVLILDEGHLAENALMHHVNVTLDDIELRKVGLKLPSLGTIQNYQTWALKIMNNLGQDMYSIKAYLEESQDPFLEEMILDRFRKLQKAYSSVSGMVRVKDDWIMEKHNRKVMFRPLWVKEHGTLYTAAADKVVLMSATIVSPKKMAELMGIEDFDYIEIPSSFPKERRPFYYYPVVKVDQKATEQDYTKLVNEIDKIIEKNDGKRGIIHTVNYHIRDLILLRSKYSNIMLSHGSADRESVIEEFLVGEGKKRILVSPSVMSGINAPYHRCAFQIIVKVPFRDRKEEQVKRRMAEDPEWYSFSAACDIVQAYGRAMRYSDDYGETYMVDENFGWFYRQNEEMFPQWTKEAIKRIYQI